MKIFALKEESSDNSETVVYGWLTYFEEEKEFQIRLCEEIDYWECPIFFSPYIVKSFFLENQRFFSVSSINISEEGAIGMDISLYLVRK